MSTAYWVTGNSLAVLRALPAGSIDLVMTSPPFLALRSYLPADDPAKADEIGQEPTPGEFIDTMLDITEALAEALAPHGSIAVEFGDTYSGSGGAGGDYADGGLRDGQPAFKGAAARSRAIAEGRSSRPPRGKPKRSQFDDPKQKGRSSQGSGGAGWPMDKSLTLIPELYRFALVYGFNPLTGRTTPRWRVRNVVRWARPNPSVGELGDKFRPATSDLVIATKARDRWFDLDAVRSAHKDPTAPGRAHPRSASRASYPRGGGDTDAVDSDRDYQGHRGNPAGAPPLDYWSPTDIEAELWDQWADQLWEIPTSPYKGSHYATYPPALCERPIKAMAPLRVCTTCGQPSRRIVEAEPSPVAPEHRAQRRGEHRGSQALGATGTTHAGIERRATTVGWTDCGHDTWRPGRVLDPFAGSGTTLAVATGHARDAIGIDLDARNADLARERVGMFLTECTVDELAAHLRTPGEAAV